MRRGERRHTREVVMNHSSAIGDINVLKARAREWLEFDSVVFRKTVAFGGLAVGSLMHRGGDRYRALSIYGTVHRSAYSARASRKIEALIRSSCATIPNGETRHALVPFCRQHIDSIEPVPATAKFFAHPEKILGPLAIVLKSAAAGEKGVILLQYSHMFPVFAKLFNIEAIARRYYIVLEPSWSGYCDPDVLCYTQYGFPVFVEAYEPRDAEFIRATRSNLAVVPTSTNWWVDHRIFRPLPDVGKDVDLIMVAGWGAYKRHDRFFAALRTLRRRHIRPKVVLIGYRLGMSKDDILRSASLYGVLDQIECHEGLTQSQVNHHLNRAKVSIIWSRKEGVNRAIVEGMFAGVPCIIREGFNYGYPYPYINSATGCFSSEDDLPDTIVRMIDRHADYAPRKWVMANMSAERATHILSDAVGQVARAAGESWSGGLAVKLNGLDNVYYRDTDASERRFTSDYAFLRTAIRNPA